MITLTVCADHAIGAELCRQLLDMEKAGRISIKRFITTDTNTSGWWPALNTVVPGGRVQVYNPLVLPAPDSDSDYLLLLSWKHLLPPAWISWARIAAINLHYSLLPKFRGVYPVNWALIQGETSTGISFHEVNESIDAGRILLQKPLEITATDTAGTLLNRLDTLTSRSFPELITLLESGAVLHAAGQQTGSGYYSRKRFDAVRALNLTRAGTLGEHINLLRGLTFQAGTQLAYFFCPLTGRKINVRIELTEDENE
jgi:folate-dependent phosphoribosylglycinamide formyltransferase PurN